MNGDYLGHYLCKVAASLQCTIAIALLVGGFILRLLHM